MATTKIDRTGQAHTELTTTEARQARPVGLIWVLSISMTLAVIAGIALGYGWITIPWGA
jgi:hypothetical protein